MFWNIIKKKTNFYGSIRLRPLFRNTVPTLFIFVNQRPNWVSSPSTHMRTETHPLSETLSFLVQKPNNSECYTPTDRLCGLVVTVPGYTSRGPGFDSRRYQIFWEVVTLERGPLSLIRITEELPEWKSSGSGSRKPRFTAVGIRCADHTTSSIRKALTSATSGGPMVGIFSLRTKSTEFSFSLVELYTIVGNL
jgi:hypothetical protein